MLQDVSCEMRWLIVVICAAAVIGHLTGSVIVEGLNNTVIVQRQMSDYVTTDAFYTLFWCHAVLGSCNVCFVVIDLFISILFQSLNQRGTISLRSVS